MDAGRSLESAAGDFCRGPAGSARLTTANSDGGIGLAAIGFRLPIHILVGIAIATFRLCAAGGGWIIGFGVEFGPDVYTPRSNYRTPCPRAYCRIRIRRILRVKRRRPP